MEIIQFRIQGFKDIQELKGQRSSTIAAFSRLSEGEKSHLFEAFDLWCWVLSNVPTSSSQTLLKRLKKRFGASPFHPEHANQIRLEFDIEFPIEEFADLKKSPVDLGSYIAPQLTIYNKTTTRLMSRIEMTLNEDQLSCSMTNWDWDGEYLYELEATSLAKVLSNFRKQIVILRDKNL